MIDIKFLKENPELVKANIKKKFQDRKLPLVDEVIALDTEKREAETKGNSLRAQKNRASKEIGMYMAKGMKEEADKAKLKENKEKEKQAFSTCEKMVLSHGLDMKLVDVEYSFDGSKILFYFTADGRVDFRDLVKDLASTFHTRIELRQIGVRDEAKMLGGLGICGQPFCCAR